MGKPLFDTLGFSWNRDAIPTLPNVDAAVAHFAFHKNMAEFVWDAAVLEGNPCTLPQVQTLMNGITVGGLKISDQDQVIHLAEACQQLYAMLKEQRFQLNRNTFLSLHQTLAKEEALEWGVFRGEGKHTDYTPYVALGEHTAYNPLPTEQGAANLIRVFENGKDALLQHSQNPFERAAAFFLFSALQQFFFDGNKRTSRLMMNGIFMTHNLHALSLPAAKAQNFHQKMVNFYLTKDATEMFAFLEECYKGT